MKIRRLIFILILATAFIVSVLYHYLAGVNSDAQNREFSVLLAERVSDALDAELNGPIQVSLAMSQDVYIHNILNNEGSVAEADIEAALVRYLNALKEKVGYADAFIVSDGTKRHFGVGGMRNSIDPTSNPQDIWYPLFLDTGKNYDLNVDSNTYTDNVWMVYVNTRINGTNGDLLGVCGVSVRMDDLQGILSRFEQAYGVKLTIVDENGLVKADVDQINIDNTYRKVETGSESGDYVYTKKGENGYTVTKYLPEFSWYLVVKNDGRSFVRTSFDPKFLMISTAMFLAIVGAYILFFNAIHERKKGAVGTGQTDELTGTWTRNYFKDVFGEHGILNTTRYKTIAVFDIDSFKEANDTLNGDEILKFVIECAQKHIGPKGECFRWGGDEFMVLMEWSMDFAEGICREFCDEVADDGRVTVSIGIATVRLSDTIKTNYYRAVQGCYLIKEMGGNGVKVCDL